MRILPEDDYEYLFSFRNAIYTYENFLQAIAKFPMFCNEKPETNDLSYDDTCKKEIASVIAHTTQETGANAANWGETWLQSLYWISEIGCAEGTGCTYDSACDPSTWQG